MSWQSMSKLVLDICWCANHMPGPDVGQARFNCILAGYLHVCASQEGSLEKNLFCVKSRINDPEVVCVRSG
jgi:hypothetical protein